MEKSLWIVIESKEKVKAGIIYMHRRVKNKEKELYKMYDRMSEEVNKAKVNNERIIVMGNLICKVGGKKAGNKNEVTKE